MYPTAQDLLCCFGYLFVLFSVAFLLSLLGEKKLKWLCASWLLFNIIWFAYYFPNYH
jgi:hypothetical protein